jgi:hypothetical protein
VVARADTVAVCVCTDVWVVWCRSIRRVRSLAKCARRSSVPTVSEPQSTQADWCANRVQIGGRRRMKRTPRLQPGAQGASRQTRTGVRGEEQEARRSESTLPCNHDRELHVMGCDLQGLAVLMIKHSEGCRSALHAARASRSRVEVAASVCKQT